jgi:hypothetical protein
MLAVLLVALCAGGWCGEGNQVVALISERHLNDQARAGIRELLGDGVNISDAPGGVAENPMRTPQEVARRETARERVRARTHGNRWRPAPSRRCSPHC